MQLSKLLLKVPSREIIFKCPFKIIFNYVQKCSLRIRAGNEVRWVRWLHEERQIKATKFELVTHSLRRNNQTLSNLANWQQSVG